MFPFICPFHCHSFDKWFQFDLKFINISLASLPAFRPHSLWIMIGNLFYFQIKFIEEFSLLIVFICEQGGWDAMRQDQKSPSWCLCNLKWGSKLRRQKRWSFIHLYRERVGEEWNSSTTEWNGVNHEYSEQFFLFEGCSTYSLSPTLSVMLFCLHNLCRH